MKKILYYFLNKMFGKKRFYRFFLILKNIGIQGLNYRNTEIEKNGELVFINKISNYFKQQGKNIILFDVGANVGNYSKTLAEQFQADAQIFSFEPFSVPFKKLKELASTYKNIKPFQIGLSDKNEDLTIYSSDEFSEIGGVYNRSFIFHDMPHDKQEVNQFKTIDSFCNEHAIKHIHFLKIDVEGHELAVLKGASSFIENSQIDFIQFEFGAGNHFSRTYFMDFFNLLKKNYTIYRLLKDDMIEISAYNSELEMQILTYYVAISKNHASKFD
jgi:FkbM family methyltransferase